MENEYGLRGKLEGGPISRWIPGVSTYNLAGTLDGLTLLDETVGTEQHDTDLAGLEVHAHTLDTGGEPVVMSVCRIGKCQDIRVHVLDQLLSLDVGHTVDTGDTVTVQELNQFQILRAVE